MLEFGRPCSPPRLLPTCYSRRISPCPRPITRTIFAGHEAVSVFGHRLLDKLVNLLTNSDECADIYDRQIVNHVRVPLTKRCGCITWNHCVSETGVLTTQGKLAAMAESRLWSHVTVELLRCTEAGQSFRP